MPIDSNTVREFTNAAHADPYGRLRVLLGLVQWSGYQDVPEYVLQHFIEVLRMETGGTHGLD